jgi:hypothetical protein
MGSISNIPLREETELYLLCLMPEGRTGLLLHRLNEHSRLILEVHESKGLIHHEMQTLEPGGILFSCEDAPEDVPEVVMAARGMRIVQEEFKKWDRLTPGNRIRLQLDWAFDNLRRSEADLVQAINMPFEENGCSWDIPSLVILLDRIQHVGSTIDGLNAALECL